MSIKSDKGEKRVSVQTNVPPEMYDYIVASAEYDRRSMSDWIAIRLERAIAEERSATETQ